VKIKIFRIRYVSQFYCTAVQLSSVHETDFGNVKRSDLFDMLEALFLSNFLKSN